MKPGFGRIETTFFSNSPWTPQDSLGGESVNFWVKEGTRNGMNLIDSVSGASAKILAPAAVTDGTNKIDCGTSYNPTSSCFTIYAKVKWDSSASNYCTILSSINTSNVGVFFIVRQTSGKLSTYIGGFHDSTLSLSNGVWTKVMMRYHTGASGFVEVAKDNSAFETIYTGNLQTSLLIGDAKLMLLVNISGTTGYWKGGMSEIKFFESSKEWNEVDEITSKHWVFNGQQFVPEVVNNVLNAKMTQTVTKDYTEYGSSQLLDYGFTIYEKAYNQDIYVPHNNAGENIPVTAGVDIPAGFTLKEEVSGSLTNHNLTYSYILFSGDEWDRSDITKFNDAARITINTIGSFYRNTGFYDSTQPKKWHISELNNDKFNTFCKDAHRGRIHVKFTTDSWSNRLLLKESFSFITNKTGANFLE